MINKTQILAKCMLFNGLTAAEIEEILFYLRPKVKRYKKGDFIILAGSAVQEAGVVLSGEALVIKEDIAGHRAIITRCHSGDMFAEAIALARAPKSPVSVSAQADSEIMFIDFDSVLNLQNKSAKKVVQNMLMLLARKNMFLNSKLEHVSKRNIREKLMSYLFELKNKTGKTEFMLPMSKTDLADFLFIDRSALGREFTALRREKLINFNGRKISLKI